MRTISDDERRARLALRHHLAPGARADDVAVVAGDVAGLHASDPATVLLAARARLRDATPQDIEHALYEERSVVRLLGMRRTMFVVPVDLAAVVQASSTRALLPRERKVSVGLLESSGVTDDGERWLADAEEQTLRALAARGQAKAAELSADVPALREKVGIAIGQAVRHDAGHDDARPVPARRRGPDRARPPARIVDELAVPLVADGRLAAGRPARARPRRGVGRARAPLAARVRPRDLRRPEVVDRLAGGAAAAGAGGGRPVEVGLDGGATGLVLAGDFEPVAPPAEPWTAFLPGLDPAPMGWTARDWYLGPTASACSTAAATSARRSGGMAASSAAGHSARTATSRSRCSRTRAPKRRPRSPPKPSASASGSATSASRRAFAPRSNASCARAEPPSRSGRPAAGTHGGCDSAQHLAPRACVGPMSSSATRSTH